MCAQTADIVRQINAAVVAAFPADPELTEVAIDGQRYLREDYQRELVRAWADKAFAKGGAR